MRQFSRSSRLEEQILRDVSMIIEEEYRERFPAFVTLTKVRVSNDLRYATIYYSVLGDESKKDRCAEILNEETKHIRHLAAGKIRVRQIPEFTFKFDTTIEEGIRLEQLFNEIRDKNKQ